MDIVYRYEIVRVNASPTMNTNYLHTFVNPVFVGDKVNPNTQDSELLKVIAVEHYQESSVLYCE